MPELSAADRDNLIRTVIGEVDPKDPDEGRAAVAHVVLNRLSTGRYGKTATDVVHARAAFEPWAKRPRELLAINPEAPEYQRAAAVVDGVLGGSVPDPTGGATHFYSPRDQATLGRKPPAWARGNGVQVGGHAFYAPEGAAPPPGADDVLAAWAGSHGGGVPANTVKTVPVAAQPGTDEELFNDWTRTGPVVIPQAEADRRAREFGGGPKGRGAQLPPVVDMPIRGTPEVQALANVRGYPGQVVQGVPVAGPLIDMATAAGAAMLPSKAGVPLKGSDDPASFSDRFVSNFEDAKRADQFFAQTHPVGSKIAQATGTVGSMVPFGMTALGSRALGMTGTSLGSRIYQGMGGGGAIAGLDATLRGDDLEGIGKQTLFGAAGGAVGPIAGDAVARGASSLLNRAYPRPGPLGDVNRVGREMLSGAIEGETPASIAAARARMGQAGYLADLNPAMTDLAGGIADTPGPGKAIVREAFRQRATQTPDRIENALTTSFGPRTNVLDTMRSMRAARSAQADPLYDAWRDTQVHPTPELKALMPRLEAADVISLARSKAAKEGLPFDQSFFTPGPQKAYPTAQSWDYVKRGLDSKIATAQRAGDNDEVRVLSGIRGDLIHAIDNHPNPDVAGVWQQARQVYAHHSSLMDQLELGQHTFSNNYRAEDLADELRGLSKPELQARIQGARDAVEKVLGDTVRGDTNARNMLLARNSQDKLRLMLGNRADPLLHSLESEAYLRGQTENVIGGSQTAPKTARINALQPPPAGQWNPSITSPLSLIPPSWIDAIRPSTILEGSRADRYAGALRQMAPVLTTQRGPGFDALISDLMREQAIAQRSAMVGGRLGRGATGATTGVISPEERHRLYGGGEGLPALVSPAR